jgi:hypothetical protein
MNDHFPSIDELKPKQQKKLIGHAILAVEIVGEPWQDDHELCCDLKVTTTKGTVQCSLWWVGWEFLAAVRYANDLPAALKAASEEIQGRISEEA